MENPYITKREAAEAWVNGFTAIPTRLLERIMIYNPDEVCEITPPCIDDRVYVTGGPHEGHYGEVMSRDPCAKDEYIVHIDDMLGTVIINESDLSVQHDNDLPIWGKMWAFGNQIDNDWLSGVFDPDALRKTASCGFRIFEQDDFGYLLGIDGAGYDFYEAHWNTSYDARGLHRHDDD